MIYPGRAKAKATTIGHSLANDGARTTGLRVWTHLAQNSIISPICSWCLPETHYEALHAWEHIGYWPSITAPQSFNEHIMHRKLCTDDPRYATIEDKLLARRYVDHRVSDAILPELYHTTTNPSTIPSAALPDAFVVKATHGSGMNKFVHHRDDFHPQSLINTCERWLTQTYGTDTREYWYADITPRIIIEEYLTDDQFGHPLDFKCYVFHGRVEVIEVHMDRFGNHRNRLYDREWRPLNVRYEFPLAPAIDRPAVLDEMIEVAESLAKGFDFLRVDLYAPNDDKVIFGELTVAPGAGNHGFQPVNFDFVLGSYWSGNRGIENLFDYNNSTDRSPKKLPLKHP